MEHDSPRSKRLNELLIRSVLHFCESKIFNRMALNGRQGSASGEFTQICTIREHSRHAEHSDTVSFYTYLIFTSHSNVRTHVVQRIRLIVCLSNDILINLAMFMQTECRVFRTNCSNCFQCKIECSATPEIGNGIPDAMCSQSYK